MKVVITAGPTREFLDPVRFLSNPSTGRMGFACASEGVDRGHDVVLISGPVSLPTPDGLRRVDVVSASDMWEAVRLAFGECDVLIMCAAVADWTVDVPAETKLKKGTMESLTVSLIRTRDILASVSAENESATLVGFAAETDHVIEAATHKLKSKGLDLIVANDVTVPGAGFGGETNVATLLPASGGAIDCGLLTKRALAARIFDWVEATRRSD